MSRLSDSLPGEKEEKLLTSMVMLKPMLKLAVRVLVRVLVWVVDEEDDQGRNSLVSSFSTHYRLHQSRILMIARFERAQAFDSRFSTPSSPTPSCFSSDPVAGGTALASCIASHQSQVQHHGTSGPGKTVGEARLKRAADATIGEGSTLKRERDGSDVEESTPKRGRGVKKEWF
jgi:hypothetical protein